MLSVMMTGLYLELAGIRVIESGAFFSRIFTLLRAMLWSYTDLKKLIESCGTASHKFKMIGTPDQAYLSGLQRKRYGIA